MLAFIVCVEKILNIISYLQHCALLTVFDIMQGLAFEICSHVPKMHNLRQKLDQLTTGESKKNLKDQQNHLDALWNHLLKRLAQKQCMLRRQSDDVISNVTFKLSAVESALEKWLKRLKESVAKFCSIPDVFDCNLDIDLAALKLLSSVCVSYFYRIIFLKLLDVAGGLLSSCCFVPSIHDHLYECAVRYRHFDALAYSNWPF